MSWTVRFTAEAEADLQQSYDWYERQGIGVIHAKRDPKIWKDRWRRFREPTD